MIWVPVAPVQDAMADFFISYTSTDSEWAHWIAKELQSLGHAPHVHEWEIKGGDDIYAWMEQRHDAAEHVLCVVSDEYMKAPFSTLERNAAMWQSAKNRPGFVLFVVVKPSRLPSLSDHIRRCELFGVPEDAARVRFREFMNARAVPDAVTFPGQVFAVSNIPIRVPAHFMGRDDALAAIETVLMRDQGSVAVAALHGLRGVGKTTLAAAYAERHRGDYRATWWVGAQTPSSARADIVALGVRLGWIGADDKEEPALAAVMERLRHEGEGVLLIFDNAMDAAALKPYLPRGGRSQILVTSNAHAWRGIATPIEIRFWPRNVGAEYLLVRTGGADERAAAEALSDALGGLPLAHEQAAAYCERLEKSLSDYLKRFEAAPARLLGDERDAPTEYHDRLTVTKTFGLAIEEAGKLHPGIEPLIVHAALLAPEPIPLFLFTEGRESFGEPFVSALADEDELDEIIAGLRAFALVDRETIPDERDPGIRTETIRLHRLVRQTAAARCVGDAREVALRGLTQAVAALYPREVFDDPKTWPRARRLGALAQALVGDETAPAKGAEAAAAALLYGLASYQHGALAAYAQARPLYERALSIYEKLNGPDHPDTALCLNNLALLLQAQGDLSGARPFHERALAAREKALGAEHPDTAESLSNLALLLQAQDDLAGARPLYERALEIYQKALGAEHPATATSLNNLAWLLQAQGDLAGARPVYERALSIYEKALGPEHPSTAASLDNLASLLWDQGDLAGARPLLERVLAIREKTLGPEHPATATSLNNLAVLLHEQGDLAAARPLYERALTIYEKAVGPDQATTNRGRRNLARLLVAVHCPAEALVLGQAALAAHESALGPDHAWTVDSARVTAEALDALGRTDEADALRARYKLAAAVPASGQIRLPRALCARRGAAKDCRHPSSSASL